MTVDLAKAAIRKKFEKAIVMVDSMITNIDNHSLSKLKEIAVKNYSNKQIVEETKVCD